jgi:hypothetical protein
MSKRSRPDGPCRTKATYDHKRPKYDPPSPERQLAAQQELASACAKARNRNQLSSAGRYRDVLRTFGLLK